MALFRHELLLGGEPYISHEPTTRARIVTRNGEIDIIGKDGEVLVFKKTTHAIVDGDRVPIAPPLLKKFTLRPGEEIVEAVMLKVGRATLKVKHL